MGGVYIVQLAPGTVAGVEQAEGLQLFKISVINRAALALGRGLHIPIQTQPQKILPQNCRIFLPSALGVQILHPQDHRAATAFHRKPGDEGSKHIAQVHPAGGGGRKAAHGGSIHGYACSRKVTVPVSASIESTMARDSS